MRSTSLRRLGILMLGAVAAACDGPPFFGARTVRDSAGIEIVVQPLHDAERWTLRGEPVLDLSAPGDSLREFFYVWDGTFLSDGSVAVINGSTNQIRIFSPDGSEVRQFGREGDGPGEFRLAYTIFAIAGDRLIVADPRHPRVSIFDRNGRLTEDATLPRVRMPVAVGWLGDDRVLLSHQAVEPEPGKVVQQSVQYTAFSWSSGALDSLARIPSGTIELIGGFEPWGVVGGALFEAEAHAAAISGFAVLADGGEPDLRFTDAHGKLERILRWPATGRRVTQADLAAYRATTLAEMPSDEYRMLMTKQLDARRVAERFPVMGDVLSDRDGRVWVQRYVEPRDTLQTWHVFDLTSGDVAVIGLPLGMRLLDATGRRLLVVERDELDVEHPLVYEVLTPR